MSDLLGTYWEQGADGFCLFDERLRCLRLNRAAENAARKGKNGVSRRRLGDLFPALKSFESEFRAVLKTGRTAVSLGVPLAINDGKYARVCAFKTGTSLGLILSDMTALHLREDDLRSSLAQIKKLTQHDNKLREDERRRMARKIHEEMAPLLTTFKMDLYWVLKRLKSEGLQIQLINDRLAEMDGLIDSTIASVRELCTELRPALLEEIGLQAAMEWQVQELRKRTPLEWRMDIDENGASVDPDLSLCLFRILQEGTANILRHAGATKALVSFRFLRSKKVLELIIKDNGRGIRPEEASDPKAFGLIGIRERLSPYAGRLKIDGHPGRGTTIKVSIPLASPRS